EPVCSCAHSFAHFARETAGAACTRHSLLPLFLGRGHRMQTSGTTMPRERTTVTPVIARSACDEAIHSRGKMAHDGEEAGMASLTPLEIVIKYNYSAQEVIQTHGKRRLLRRRGSIRPAQDRTGGCGADRGPQPSGQAQCAERRHYPRDPGLLFQPAR